MTAKETDVASVVGPINRGSARRRALQAEQTANTTKSVGGMESGHRPRTSLTAKNGFHRDGSNVAGSCYPSL